MSGPIFHQISPPREHARFDHPFTSIGWELFQQFLRPDLPDAKYWGPLLWSTYNNLIQNIRWTIPFEQLENIGVTELSETAKIQVIGREDTVPLENIHALYRKFGFQEKSSIKRHPFRTNYLVFDVPFRMYRHPYILLLLQFHILQTSEKRNIKFIYAPNLIRSTELVKAMGVNFHSILELLRGAIIEFLVYLWNSVDVWSQNRIRVYQSFVLCPAHLDRSPNYDQTAFFLEQLIADLTQKCHKQDLTGEGIDLRENRIRRFEELWQHKGSIDPTKWLYILPENFDPSCPIGLDYFFPPGFFYTQTQLPVEKRQLLFLKWIFWYFKVIMHKNSQNWSIGYASPPIQGKILTEFLAYFFDVGSFSDWQVKVPPSIFQKQNTSSIFAPQYLKMESYIPYMLFIELFLTQIIDPNKLLNETVPDQYWVKGLPWNGYFSRINTQRQVRNQLKSQDLCWNFGHHLFVYIQSHAAGLGHSAKEYFHGRGTRVTPFLNDLKFWCKSNGESEIFQLIFTLKKWGLIKAFGYEGFALGYRTGDYFLKTMANLHMDFPLFRNSYPDFWVITNQNRILIFNVLGSSWKQPLHQNMEYPYKNEYETRILADYFQINTIFFAHQRIQSDYYEHTKEMRYITGSPFLNLKDISPFLEFCESAQTHNQDLSQIFKEFAKIRSQTVHPRFDRNFNQHPVYLLKKYHDALSNPKISFHRPRIKRDYSIIQEIYEGKNWVILDQNRYLPETIDATKKIGIYRKLPWEKLEDLIGIQNLRTTTIRLKNYIESKQIISS